jgi:anaerobic magnesium-protoporphyrin IX monomethyl ester cyclase
VKKILLITPPYHCGVVEVAGRWLPLNLLYLATAARRAGYEAKLYDAMSRFDDEDDIVAKVKEEQPDLVGIPSITATVPSVLRVARLIKTASPTTRVIVGGVHPTFMPEEMLRESRGAIDFVVCGEGEQTVEELLRTLKADDDPRAVAGLAFLDADGSFVKTLPRTFLHDLEAYPAAFDLPDWSIYRYFVIPDSRLGAVSTSRGCDHTCTFCSQQKFWNRSWRSRKPSAVVSEIESLYREYGANVILISDEYPTSDAARWEEILDRIIALELPLYLLMETRAEDIVRDRAILPKYRKAGVVHIYVGLEATDQETLDLINKELTTDVSREALQLIRDHGMLSETSFVLGFPHETEETIQRTLELAKHFDPDMAHFLCITPWPYADLWDEMKDRVRVHDYSRYNLIEPVVEPEALTLDELDAAIVRCYRDFYMGKMRDFMNYPDEFRRRYMLSSMKLIMKSSFLVEKIGRLAMPAQIAQMLAGGGAGS